MTRDASLIVPATGSRRTTGTSLVIDGGLTGLRLPS